MSYSVVILSKNAQNLHLCLAAIEHFNPHAQVIVVDDGLAFRPESSLLVCYLDGIKPFVFSTNANLGIFAACNGDVLLLNDDALLRTPLGFDRLARIANRDVDVGILSPATSGVGNENQSLWAEGDSSKQGLRYEPKVLCFVCVYIRRDVLKAVGPLDERFTQYGWEDNDYCRRVLAHKNGYKLGIYDPVQVDHTSSKSSFRGFGHCDITFNQRIYEEKWGRSS